MKKTEFIVVAVVLLFVVVLAFLANRQLFEYSPAPSSTSPSSAQSVTPSTTWKTYTSSEFGFSFQYPATWQSSKDPLTIANPHIFFGNPLNGTTTYDLKIFAYANPQNLTPADYVAQMIANGKAQDASNSVAGPAPQTTPKFSKQYSLTVANYSAYELYDVFEFDHDSEQIYIQQNKQMLVFDFPMPDANPNLSDPVTNNAIAHAILGTLTIDSNVWKFCGGIAAGQFQCAGGYACKLDGSYSDAGGHCEKN